MNNKHYQLIIIFFAVIQIELIKCNDTLVKKSLELILLHNNDMHARFEQTGIHSNECKPEDSLNNQCFGGFARVATV